MRPSFGRAQSAVEFVTTYSYVFLIITVVLSVLFLYFSLPKTIVPVQCTFYSGFSCADASLIIKGSSAGGTLIVVAFDNQQGIINTSTFNAVINNQKSTVGWCLPQSVIIGQTIYCEANFSFTPVQSSVYSGTFFMKGNYCANAPSNLSFASCPANSNFIFSGNIRIQPTGNYLVAPLNSIINKSSLTSWYVPITLQNNQPAPTPVPFQDLITVNSLVYYKYINPAWTNVEFTTQPAGRGQAIQAWIESAASNTATNTLVWLKLPNGIAANSNMVVYMNMFNSGNYMSANGPTGEAAWLGGPYGQWDTGSVVFPFYDNFAGTTLQSWWTPFASGNGGSYTISNGLTLSSSGSPAWSGELLTSTNSYIYSPSAYVVDGYVKSLGATGVTAVVWSNILSNTVGCEGLGTSPTYAMGYAADWYSWGGPGVEVQAGNSAGCYGNPLVSGTSILNSYTELGNEWSATGNMIELEEYTKGLVTTDANILNLPSHFELSEQYSGAAASSVWYWARLRYMPPGTFMPSNTFGALTRST